MGDISFEQSPLQVTLKALRNLRSTVSDVFTHLGSGLSRVHGDETQEKNFLQDLQQILQKVEVRLRDLEVAANNLSPPASGYLHLGSSGYLGQDPAHEKTLLFNQLVQSYGWTDKITLSRVLKAIVIFKGLMIEWVVVRGLEEPTVDEDGLLDPWTPSCHLVFRKVTDNANAAMLHYFSPMMPELAVKSFMTWFHSYVKLFSDVCKKCQRHLHHNMPPTWRDFRVLDPYHEDCKPLL
ncbi:unnamed protein product [Darwinula stevensoni]|uniref:Mediator complex subunit 27 n=1 Tax=Darwinula stevensoni TaxID=69355 RepID=A0A7R8XHB1_9CRUS|nr:unnamed protein product [Darwinula stevensoni]CAG0890265.1 unnamed protein product [Darwinula stevensoni]